MAKLESSFINMVLSLTLITLLAAGALGGVYVLTKEPIEQAKAQKQVEAISKVLPPYSTLADPIEAEGMITHIAYDEQGAMVGAAVETAENGFGGKFRVMVGFDTKGQIVSYEVLEHQETPGLGSHMAQWFKTDKNSQSICGKSPAEGPLTVSKDGGEVDAITAATISSRAFLLAINNAYGALQKQELLAVAAATDTVDAASGASVITHEVKEEGEEAAGEESDFEKRMKELDEAAKKQEAAPDFKPTRINISEEQIHELFKEDKKQ